MFGGAREACGVRCCAVSECRLRSRGCRKNARTSPGPRCAACRARFLLPYPATVNNNQPRASVAECSAGFVAETLASKLQTVDAKDGGVLSGVRG